MPEGLGLLRPNQFLYQVFNFVGRLRAALKMKHVAFRLEPVSQVDASQHQGLAIAVDQIWPGSVNEAFLGNKPLEDKWKKEQESETIFQVGHGEPSIHRQPNQFGSAARGSKEAGAAEPRLVACMDGQKVCTGELAPLLSSAGGVVLPADGGRGSLRLSSGAL